MPKYPASFKPTSSYSRKLGPFSADYGPTCALLEVEVRRIKGSQLVVDLERRIDGSPKTGPGVDPGVVVHFHVAGRNVALACDRFTTAAANLRAVALSMERKRLGTIYGVTTLEQEYEGYAMLPDGVPTPHSVLGVAPDAPREVVEAAFRAQALKHHPDRGGNSEEFQRIKKARDALLREA